MTLTYPQMRLFVVAPNYQIARSWAEVDNRILGHRWGSACPPSNIHTLYGRPQGTLIQVVTAPGWSLDSRVVAEIDRFVAVGRLAHATVDDLDWFRIPWSEIDKHVASVEGGAAS